MRLRIIILWVLAFIYSYSGNAQSFLSGFEIAVGLAYEEHDERLYNYPLAEELQASEEDFGSSIISLDLGKNFKLGDFISTRILLGYAKHTSRFSRPFNVCPFIDGPCITLSIIHLADRYQKNLFTQGLEVDVSLMSSKTSNFKMGIGIDVTNTIVFKKSIGKAFSDNSINMFDFYNFEVLPGIWTNFGKLAIRLKYRIASM